MSRRSRLTDRQKYAAARDRQTKPRRDETNRQRWARGEVIPNRITVALDAAGLYGPEVDTACGAAEPDVDRWESGDLYPTWEQLQALADLTGLAVSAFFLRPVTVEWTTAQFHIKNYEPPPPPVLAFKPEALRAAGIEPPHAEVLALRPVPAAP